MDEKIEREALKASRREMLTGSGKKLKYVIPTMWVLAAAPRAFGSAGQPPSVDCLASGQACNIDEDCCSLDCQGMSCQTVMMSP